jgi:hypothetical protein
MHFIIINISPFVHIFPIHVLKNPIFSQIYNFSIVRFNKFCVFEHCIFSFLIVQTLILVANICSNCQSTSSFKSWIFSPDTLATAMFSWPDHQMYLISYDPQLFSLHKTGLSHFPLQFVVIRLRKPAIWPTYAMYKSFSLCGRIDSDSL